MQRSSTSPSFSSPMFLRNIQRSDGDRCVERYRSRCDEETDWKRLSHGFELPESHTSQAILWRKGKGVNSGENWGIAQASLALRDAKAAQGQNRILALKDGGIQPLMGKTPLSRPSPSPSLLVERFDLETSHWQTHLHADQVVAQCLKPPITEHERKGECGRESPLVQGQVAICDRN